MPRRACYRADSQELVEQEARARKQVEEDRFKLEDFEAALSRYE
jgi:hypothetical protein